MTTAWARLERLGLTPFTIYDWIVLAGFLCLLTACVILCLLVYARFARQVAAASAAPPLVPLAPEESPVSLLLLFGESQKILDRLEKQELALARLTEALTIRLETHEHKTEQQLMKIRQEARIPTNGVGTIGGM